MTPEERAKQILRTQFGADPTGSSIHKAITEGIRQAVLEEREACAEIADRTHTHYYAEHVDPDLDEADRTLAYKACEEIRNAIRDRK